MEPMEPWYLREEPHDADVDTIRALVTRTGFFHDYEVAIAVELVEERVKKGEASGYFFLFLEDGKKMLGYTCYGPIACTLSSYDLFWIAVDPAYQGKGWGKLLMQETEKRILARGGTRVYIETSNRPQYASTRQFYLRCGYTLVSLLEDFYAPGDAKATYCKVLAPSPVKG